MHNVDTLANPKVFLRLLPLWGVLLTLGLVMYSELSRDLWTDEAFTASYTAHPTFASLIDDVRKNEETPPIYFISIWLWSRVFGASEVSLRSLSLLYGAGAVLVYSLWLRQRLGPMERVVAVSVMASAPLFQRYLIEARGYTLTVLLTVICIATFEDLYQQPEQRAAQLRYALSAALLFLTSYFSVALLAAHWLIWLSLLREPSSRWRRLRTWIGIQVIIAVCLLPWLPAFLYQLQVADAVTAKWNNELRYYYYMFLGLLMGTVIPGAWFNVWLVSATAGLSLMFIAISSDRAMVGLVLRVLVVPMVILTLMVVVMHVVSARYLIVILPGSALATGVGFAVLHKRRPWLAWTLIALLTSGILGARISVVPVDTAGGWTHLSMQIASKAHPDDDIIIFHPPWDQRTFEYYYRGPTLPMAGVYHYDDFYYTQGHKLIWNLAEVLPVLEGHQRIWVVYNQRYHLIPLLDLPYQQVDHWREGRLELFLYEVPPQPSTP